MNFSKESVEKKHKSLVSTPRKLSTKLMVNIFRVFIFSIILVCVAGGFLALGMAKSIIDGAPDVNDLSIAPAGYSTIVYDSDGNEIEKLAAIGSNRIPVSIDQIPTHLQYAFIDLEDERFYDHNGIDIKGILRAGVQFLQGSKQGASTFTQQLLKNNVFESGGRESNMGALIKRKIQEQYLALELEKTTSKPIILENYLNTIYLGCDCYGVQAAALRYFNKDVSELTISESAVIAAITQNPTKFYNPVYNPENNAKRRKTALDNMLEFGHITQEEYDEAINDDVYSRIQLISSQNTDSNPYSYFVDELIDQVIQDLMDEKGYTSTQAANALYSGGLSIYSTQDSAVQRICDEEMSNPANYPANVYYSFDWRWSVKHADGTIENFSNVNINYYHKTLLGESNFKIIFNSKEEAQACIDAYKAAYLKEGDEILGENVLFTLQPQASFTVIDQRTGKVLALVGGRGEKETSLSLNRATSSARQPGSCFKVLASFLPALENGQTLATVYDDAPFNYANGRAVNNWWRTGYAGLQNIRYAITRSANIIAVKTVTSISPDVSMEYLQNLGITSLVSARELADGSILSDANQAIALGGITDGIYNLEITNAYAAIANGGIYNEPIYYTKITDYNGRVILEREPESRRVIKDSTAWLLTNAMHDVVTNSVIGTGGGANVSGQYIAGKTGTTTNSYDLWFVGYSDYLTAGIWTGFDENADIGKYTGNEGYHSRLWSKIMSRIHTEKGYSYSEPTQPDSVVTERICSKCGYLAVDGLCDKDPEGSKIITEYFAKGTVPTENCKCHVEYTICSDSGSLATDKCPEASKKKVVYRYRFLGHDGTTADTPYEIPAGLENSSCILH